MFRRRGRSNRGNVADADTRDDPEHRRNQADGEREESLDGITHDGGSPGGKRTDPVRRRNPDLAAGRFPARESDRQDQRGKQQHGRQAVIDQVRDIFVVRSIKIGAQGDASLACGKLVTILIHK